MAREVPSDEADKQQLELAQKAGRAYREALDYMIDEVADNGAVQPGGDYLVAIAQERAEGMYHLKGEELVWEEPDEENCHLEVGVADSFDQRFIPGLEIKATVSKAGGETVAQFDVPFLWHPGLYHYGRNIKIPASGKYDVTVEIAPPKFMRHDQTNGKRYAKPVRVTFKDFEMSTGQE